MLGIVNDGLQAALEGWTVVLAGAWNTQIFQPEWVARHIFEVDAVELQIALTPSVLNLRYAASDATLVVHSERLIFGVREANEAAISSCELYANRVITLLPHTPISAVGINFSFVQSDPPDQFLKLLSVDDANALADFGLVIKSTQLNRAIEVNDATLNLQISLEGARMHCLFNYHHEKGKWDAASKSPRSPLLLRSVSDLLRSVYNTAWSHDNG
jgi:hypothetical protein